MALTETASRAGMRNSVRRREEDRDMAVLTGGLSDVSTGVRGG